jgi:hypothetical protein
VPILNVSFVPPVDVTTKQKEEKKKEGKEKQNKPGP